MIPRGAIIAWREQAPWRLDWQVEQDLLLSRCVIELFSDPVVRANMAFRGGTALHKVHLPPAVRYSEDIDLVQIVPGPIGPVIDAVRNRLDDLLGPPRRQQKRDFVTLTYRVESELPPVVPLRVKIEINTREHFTVLGLQERPFEVESRWFSGRCDVVTYHLDELLGTKLRALYQRRKGRDLFDLWYALSQGRTDPATIVECFTAYLEHHGLTVSRREFLENLGAKMRNEAFLGDTEALLGRGVGYEPTSAHELVVDSLLALL